MIRLTRHGTGEANMRYRETGNVHLDFHRTLNGTIQYLREKYGQDFVDEVFRRTARDVYRSIREDLARGDPEQLVEHWSYFLDRDRGRYTIERDGDEIRLTVHSCPAISYLEKKGLKVDPGFCRGTKVLNDALAEDSPFEIITDILGEGRCVQTIRRRTS